MSWNSLSVSQPTSNAAGAAANLTILMLTPWNNGEGSGIVARLSFPNAVNLMASKIDNKQAALGIAISASNFSDFANVCSQLITPFPFPILQQWQRRAAQLAVLEKSKLNLVKIKAATKKLSINALPSIKNLQIADVRQQAFDDAETFKTSNSLANLNAFKITKTAHDSEVSGLQALAKAGLSGGAGWRFYAANDVINALLINSPGSEYTITAMLIFQGSTSDLTLLAEVIQ